jgi:hypothetical protein
MHAQPCGGTDSWLRSEWFPKIVTDLVGKSYANFEPTRTTEGCVGVSVPLSVRMIENFIPEAVETLKGPFWSYQSELMTLSAGTPLDEIRILPFHPVYVYSSEFLAAVMLLVYEVLAHTISPLPSGRCINHWAK